MIFYSLVFCCARPSLEFLRAEHSFQSSIYPFSFSFSLLTLFVVFFIYTLIYLLIYYPFNLMFSPSHSTAAAIRQGPNTLTTRMPQIQGPGQGPGQGYGQGQSSHRNRSVVRVTDRAIGSGGAGGDIAATGPKGIRK